MNRKGQQNQNESENRWDGPIMFEGIESDKI